ncbi:DNA sulfur modification protein DndE [Halocatena pleomorpha]|uniref:DNA sulfur modification protein DndE n=1 Tax=Halocatena pleomorpha TaxID=1785090 RepID=A0A3P3R5P8_9EURY|nr:DNA sulfur modification protein DndE [Halocatena pleomorpha]RRJ28792.1 DNA sulfur modification protein DndE [Halocatena pleomorpha]
MSHEFNRITLGSDATHRLQMLKGRTGMTHNFTCRIGLCYSLNEPRPPSHSEYDTEGLTINRYTLLGEHEALYLALVKERLIQEGKDPDEDLYDELVAHLNRGVIRIFGNVKDINDYYTLMPEHLKPDQSDQANNES